MIENKVKLSINLELFKLWEEYKIYANACVKAGVFPAPFGVTEAEQSIRNRLEEFHGNNV